MLSPRPKSIGRVGILIRPDKLYLEYDEDVGEERTRKCTVDFSDSPPFQVQSENSTSSLPRSCAPVQLCRGDDDDDENDVDGHESKSIS